MQDLDFSMKSSMWVATATPELLSGVGFPPTPSRGEYEVGGFLGPREEGRPGPWTRVAQLSTPSCGWKEKCHHPKCTCVLVCIRVFVHTHTFTFAFTKNENTVLKCYPKIQNTQPFTWLPIAQFKEAIPNIGYFESCFSCMLIATRY